MQMLKQDKYQKCIELCYDCAESCDACANACLNEKDVKKLIDCIKLDLDCADVCVTTARYMSRDSALSEASCAMCAEICDARGRVRNAQEHGPLCEMRQCLQGYGRRVPSYGQNGVKHSGPGGRSRGRGQAEGQASRASHVRAIRNPGLVKAMRPLSRSPGAPNSQGRQGFMIEDSSGTVNFIRYEQHSIAAISIGPVV